MAHTGLEAGRTVSDLGINGPIGSGAHRAGGGKNRLGKDPSRTRVISYSKERRSPGWGWEEPSRTWELKSFKAGGGKNRLGERSVSDQGNFLL